MLQAAARLADGQLPYSDFWWNYGPGQPYLLAGLRELFGPSLLAWRVLRVALDAAVALLAYAIARRDAPELLALAAFVAVAAAMAFPTLPSPNPAATALGLGAILLAPRSPAGAGALAGTALAFRLDLGLAAIAGALLAAADGGRRAALARTAAGATLAGLLLLGPFVLAGGPERFWDQTVGFAFDEQSLQRLPLPGAYERPFDLNKMLEFYAPLILLVAAGLWALAALRQRPRLRVLAPAPLAVAGVLYLLARADEFHLVPLAAALPILLATAIAAEWRAARVVSAAVLVVALALVGLYGLDRKAVQAVHPPRLARIHLDVADGVRADPAEAQALASVVHYVRRRVPAGRPVFVANPRFDLVKVGNPLLYVVLERPNPTRYDVMQPGVVTTAPVQREMIRDLRRDRPGLVVEWRNPVATESEPNGAGRSSGVRVLQRYLRAQYRPVRRFGDYLVLAPR
jgi:hypothetical protein